jgi:hypothetical protein
MWGIIPPASPDYLYGEFMPKTFLIIESDEDDQRCYHHIYTGDSLSDFLEWYGSIDENVYAQVYDSVLDGKTPTLADQHVPKYEIFILAEEQMSDVAAKTEVDTFIKKKFEATLKEFSREKVLKDQYDREKEHLDETRACRLEALRKEAKILGVDIRDENTPSGVISKKKAVKKNGSK